MGYNIVDAGLKFPSTRTKRSKTEGILIHHPDADWTVQQVHNYHINTKGWNGIGYNLYIDKDGTIYSGRGLDYAGAHCTNFNSKTIGICCRGQYNGKDTEMPDAQFNALIWAIKYCKEKYGSGIYVKGHKEVASTACPGQYFPLAEAKMLTYRRDLGAANSSNTTTTQEVEDMTAEQVKKIVDQSISDYFANLEKKPVSDYAKDYMAEAKANGVTDGTNPGAYITREQVITILGRLGILGLNGSRAVSEWASKIWDEMTAEGIFDGTRPGAAITREQVAAVVSRVMDKLTAE